MPNVIYTMCPNETSGKLHYLRKQYAMHYPVNYRYAGAASCYYLINSFTRRLTKENYLDVLI